LTALILAAQNGHIEIVNSLLSVHASVDVQNKVKSRYYFIISHIWTGVVIINLSQLVMYSLAFSRNEYFFVFEDGLTIIFHEVSRL
jgi:ankyrin repeat protein